jgi:hypothetical protein
MTSAHPHTPKGLVALGRTAKPVGNPATYQVGDC